MKKNHYFLNTALAIVLGAALLIAVLVRTFVPAMILPDHSIVIMLVVSILTTSSHFVGNLSQFRSSPSRG